METPADARMGRRGFRCLVFQEQNKGYDGVMRDFSPIYDLPSSLPYTHCSAAENGLNTLPTWA